MNKSRMLALILSIVTAGTAAVGQGVPSPNDVSAPPPVTSPPPAVPSLCLAIYSRDIEAIKSSLAAGAAADTQCQTQQSAFYTLMSYFSGAANRAVADELGALFASKGSNPQFINVRRGSWGRRSLSSNFELAVSNVLGKTVAAYIARGANVNFSSGVRKPLGAAVGSYAAAPAERLAIVDMLLAAGASPYGINGRESLLSSLIAFNYPEEAQLRVISSWDFSRDDYSISDEMALNLGHQKSFAVTRALMGKGADLNHLIATGLQPASTGLGAALSRNQFDESQASRDFFAFLLENTRDLDADQGFALRSASLSQPLWVLSSLLIAGAKANVGEKSQQFDPPLLSALSRTGSGDARFGTPLERVQLLLRHGAAVDQENGYGWTTLFAVAEQGDELYPLAELLVRNGANVNRRDSDGRSILCLAVEYGSQKTAALLKSHGAHGTCAN